MGGQKVIKIEAYVVPKISSIQNGHVELARNEYPHLKDLWFSDVCKDQEQLEIDVLSIGLSLELPKGVYH